MLPLEIISKILILRGHHPESILINELINRLKFYLLTPISEGGGNFNTLPVYKKHSDNEPKNKVAFGMYI